MKQQTKKMMATLSELSLVQATSLKLHGDVAEAHGAAAAARERLEAGLPPTAEAEAELERRDRLERTRREELLASQYRLAAEAAAPAQLTRTLAPPRPAAYVPEDDALPLPRPYGAHRPFRAIPPSATMMKYVRRPPLPLSASS